MYNLETAFDENLRDYFVNPNDALAFVEEEKSKINDDLSPIELVKLKGKIGSYLRTLRKLDEAENYLCEAMTLIDEHDLGVKWWVVIGIRLAHVSQWMEDYEIAEQMFEDIIEMCELKEEVSDYLHFTLQHYGKFHFDLADYVEALECFEDALELREEVGNAEYIESSKLAIKATKKRMGCAVD